MSVWVSREYVDVLRRAVAALDDAIKTVDSRPEWIAARDAGEEFLRRCEVMPAQLTGTLKLELKKKDE